MNPEQTEVATETSCIVCDDGEHDNIGFEEMQRVWGEF